MRKIRYVVVHHTKSKWGNAETIVHWHTDPKPKGNGWSKPGYHYMVNNGLPTYRSYYKNQKIRGWDGRVEGPPQGLVEEQFASNGVLGFNANLINICLTGDFDVVEPSEAQLASLELLCLNLTKKYDLDAFNVIGHREAIALREKFQGKIKKDHGKTCPGTKFDLDEFRKRLNEANKEKEYFYFNQE